MILPRRKIPNVSPDLVLNCICAFYNCTRSNLRGRSRSQSIVEPRHVGMFIMRQIGGMRLHEIGNEFGGRDHSTVLHGIRSVNSAIAMSSEFAARVNQIQKDIEEGRIRSKQELEAASQQEAIENLVGCA